MTDQATKLQILGSLMKNPFLLNQTDKYNLTPDDFHDKIDKYIFVAIDSLHRQGADNIHPIDIDNFLSTNNIAKSTFANNNGIEYLQDAEFLSEVENFDYYYYRLKKINLLNDLNKNGVDTSEFYVENALTDKDFKINESFEFLSIDDIITKVKSKMLSLEFKYIQDEATEVSSVLDGIDDLIDKEAEQIYIGPPIQGEIFNEVISGARKRSFVIRSGSSGVSKTRQAVGDACFLAFPIRYDSNLEKWVQQGSNEKTLFIATEQSKDEIQNMVLAYLTDINEIKIRQKTLSEHEWNLLRQAKWVLEQYKDNLMIVRMQNPTIQLVKTIVRDQVIANGIENVFYDYIFISPSLLGEFKGFNLRNDEILLMFSTALKDLAVELNIFIMSSTQVNANADNNQNIRNEGSIAGSRAIINKADVGAIMARPTKEELEMFRDLSIMPNLVTDIYKVRSGQWNQVRIWSIVDLGTLRKKDVFMTDSRMEIINMNNSFNYTHEWGNEMTTIYTEQLKELNG